MTMYVLPHLLTDISGKFPDKDAVVFNGTSIAYAELDWMSNQVAFSLMQWGVKKGDRIGILLKKSIESIISIFGIMKAGAVYVPIDPLAPSARSKYIIQNCGIECLITSSQGLSSLLSQEEALLPLRKAIIVGSTKENSLQQQHNTECVTWEEIGTCEPMDVYQAPLTDGCPAYILHTSGSTGTPKGVVISHLNALSFVNMAADFFSISPYDHIASHAPLHFDLSVFDIFCSVKKGATIFLVPEALSAFPVKLAEFIDKEDISIWNSVSSVLTLLADKGALERFALDSLRLVHFSGDIMPAKYLKVLRKHMRNAVFYNIYGQTEANSSMFYKVEDIPDNVAWKIPIGKPFPNFEVFAINDRNEVIVHPDEEGELHVKSSTVALGYWNDAEMTSGKFVQEQGNSLFRTTVYKTGDIVRRDKEGNYLFVGRKDHMIKSRGYRIELSEIELVFTSHPLVSQAVAIAVPDELVGNRIIAYVASPERQNIAIHNLLDHCSRLLPKYMVPDGVVALDALPKTSTGKIDRKSLEKDAFVKYLSRHTPDKESHDEKQQERPGRLQQHPHGLVAQL